MAEFLAVSVLILIVLPSMFIFFLPCVILYWHVIDLLFFPVEVKCKLGGLDVETNRDRDRERP